MNLDELNEAKNLMAKYEAAKRAAINHQISKDIAYKAERLEIEDMGRFKKQLEELGVTFSG